MACKLAVIGIFLAAFAIPVTFASIMWVVGSGSLANVVSVTPGSVGITQATNALALDACCDVPKSTAVEYSTAQQLITTAWNIVVALVLVVWTFGWTGKLLVSQSYSDAKVKVSEQKEQRAEKKQAEARAARGGGRRAARPLPPTPRGTGRRTGRQLGVEERTTARFAEPLTWNPERPRIRPSRLVVAWLIAALALLAATYIVPGAEVEGFWGALLVALVVAVLNAILPPDRRTRLPFTLALGFVLVLFANAAMLLIADSVTEGDPARLVLVALLVALVAAAVSRAPGRGRGERRRRLLAAIDSAHRTAVRRARRHRRAGDSLPGDRRARPPGAAKRDA